MLKSAGNFLCLLEMALMGNFSFSCNRKLKCFANRSSTAVCCGTINSKESQNIKKEVKKTAASSSSIATLILANSK